jgi:2'-5' RNA ligase/endonuclease/exonuclease/phosphatase family metal-dependent hydrolase
MDHRSSLASLIATSSHDTALCLVPPKLACQSVDRLRSLYDKAWLKWPPHVNIFYPFVRPESLERACGLILDCLQSATEHPFKPFELQLNAVGVFTHKPGGTIFLHDKDRERVAKLTQLRDLLFASTGQQNGPQNEQPYNMHLTVAQSDDTGTDAHHFLVQKASLLPPVEWQVGELHVLIRERRSVDSQSSSQMKLWGTIDLRSMSLTRSKSPSNIDFLGLSAPMDPEASGDAEIHLSPTFQFSQVENIWKSYWDPLLGQDADVTPGRITVANYNVLAEFTWPPSRVRYPVLISNLLAENAAADILVVEEVTDDFLPVLLADAGIRSRYPFVSHGPPDQADVEPLPSHLNCVVLSRLPFTWTFLPLKRRHKGSIIATFHAVKKPTTSGEAYPLVLASCHLSQGLTDGSVATKKNELHTILSHLGRRYPNNPWILAGDFNISTSSYTIDAALRKKAISAQSAVYLASLESMIQEARLQDAWVVARVEHGESSDDAKRQRSITETYEGEQGATFDPTDNPLAFKLVGSGFNNRPQRYDRILVKGDSLLQIAAFNMFGFAPGSTADDTTPIYGSDHWGIRCLLTVTTTMDDPASEVGKIRVVPVQLKRASGTLSDSANLAWCLNKHGATPTVDDEGVRQRVFQTLERVLLGVNSGHTGPGGVDSRTKLNLIFLAVGSYGLGVWTGASDMDCMCIGNISSKTFFTMAIQRLRRASAEGIQILRRVKANSGTMLELKVEGTKVDLQYCAATYITEKYSLYVTCPLIASRRY